MTSPAKIAANKANARKSRGPHTAAGKANSARNAYRHGLAASTRKNNGHRAEIEAVVQAICEGTNDPLLLEQALVIAENGLVRGCIHVERIVAIERHRDPTVTPLASGDLGFARAKATWASAKLAYEVLVKAELQDAAAKSSTALGDTHVEPGPASDHAAKQPATPQPAPERDEFDAMRAAMADLERLERYRRRAFSRERRAIRRFYDIQSTCKRGD